MEQIKTIVGVDHIGYAVKDIKQAQNLFKALGYVFYEEKPDLFRRVKVSIGQNRSNGGRE